jgi:4-amino-4-deoxy-L-arabinose transferase-like glycosyltransferase
MQRSHRFVLLLGVLLIVQFLAMIFFPLADTSEPRYAATARLMSENGDWITPFFSPGVPFWGKPPLSFWAQALSFDLFGISAWAVRFPSWLATLASLFLVYRAADAVAGTLTAQRATLIYGSCALVFISGGAVLTDPFFALGTTLCMVAPILVSQGASKWWGYGFFVGLAIGLLAKGPLVFVLVGGVLPLFYLFYPASRIFWNRLPWVSGILLLIVLGLPWYVLAELKTPGFIDYFIVGEHFKRFIEPGWSGDLYGAAKRETFGMIWPFWLQAALPWSPVAVVLLIIALASSKARLALRQSAVDPYMAYFFVWAVLTPVFFTFAGNILWTYLLPAMPAFAILLARALAFKNWPWSVSDQRLGWLMGLTLVAPALIATVVSATAINPNLVKSEKVLVAYFQENADASDQLHYLHEVPFSARFYSAESARAISPGDVKQMVLAGDSLWVAIPKEDPMLDQDWVQSEGQPQYENLRYQFYWFKPGRN